MNEIDRSMVHITRERLARLDDSHKNAKTPEKRRQIERTMFEVKRDLAKFIDLSKRATEAEKEFIAKLVTMLRAVEGPLTKREMAFLKKHDGFDFEQVTADHELLKKHEKQERAAKKKVRQPRRKPKRS